MKVALVFPPQGHFTQPYLSLPSLAAWLRANGVPDVIQLDESIEAYDYFLSQERLQRSLDVVRARGEFASLNTRPRLRFSEMERFQRASEVELCGDDVVRGIEEAKRILRTPEGFYDYEQYLAAGRLVEQGLRLFSAEFAPTRLTPHGFVMRHRVERTAEMIQAIDCEAENPFVEFFREHTLPRLRAADPDLIGISLTFPSQAIATLTLCAQIKRWKPSVHITVGGGLLAYTAEKLARQDAVWSLIDSFVLLEGEGPLLALCRALESGAELRTVPNLVFRDPLSGQVCFSPKQSPLDIKKLPTPDFSDLPLDKYFSPELVLPLAITRGCYWGKCVFCTLYTVIGPGYRGRTIEQAVADMRVLSERHGTNKFYLAIEDLPPSMAKALPRAILEAGLDVQWWADARLEHEVFDQQVCDDLAASGCMRLAFGYESASERVLDLMCKGIDPERSMELVRRVRKAGISVTLYVMVGFPSETRAEARQTLATILAHREFVQEVSVRVFYLDERSEIFKRRQEFGITEIYPDPGADLQVYYDFKASDGMSRREAREAYLEFTQTLRTHFPVFENTNMLYHELKSHYFLYLCRYGSWEALRDQVLERDEDAAPALAGHPCAQSDLRRLDVAFDRASLDQRLSSVDSFSLRPRYQSDLIDDQDRERLDAELAPEEPEPGALIYDSRRSLVHSLSLAAAELLDRCNGARSVAQILDPLDDALRPQGRACLEDLARSGLLKLPASVVLH